MCGIAGYFGTRRIAEHRIVRCEQLMGRRGPDGRGRYAAAAGSRNILLLHSRLSIIDLDPRSDQPFHELPQVLAFNGEIYNYVELRAQLRSQGEVFRTEGDTEVLAKLLRRDAAAGLDLCEGMWAFACFDRTNNSLLLSRDRFGEKPLYLFRSEDGLYFGSEPKFLFALLGRKLPINERQILRYIVNGYKSLYKTRDTFFEDLEELPPATILRIDAAGTELSSRYWTPAFRPNTDLTVDDAVAGVRARLIESVRVRLRSDVPLAFLLSGGVDSNVLTAIAKRVLNYDVHGFTVVNDDERYDERAIVDQSVAELAIRHTPVPITSESFLPRLRELIGYHDAPVYTITYYVQWLLMQDVHRHGYKITISGTGADEILSGYYDHHLMHLYEIDGTPLHGPTLAAWEQNIKPLVRNPYLSNPNLFVEDADFRDHIYLGAENFASCLTKPFAETFAEEHYAGSLLRNRMMNEMFHESVPVILHEDDLNAMYYSIENRSPYLDRKLFEFCYTIPDAYLIRDGFNKVLLRDAGRGIAPDHVLDRRTKVGFNAPVLSFLDPSQPEVYDELTRDGPLFDVMQRDRMIDMLGKRSLPNSESKFLFNLINTKIFLETYAA
jgi:asparagine synthase (glutamine-hydrolysing)